MSNQVPRVSVVMSVYNGSAFLAESIESILNQTFTDFEFIIVNDGSTDCSLDILTRYAQIDPRIRVIDQPNAGLTCALIDGCQLAQGELIARQDDDDLSRPERLQRQVEYLDTHPSVGFVTCMTRYLGPKGELLELMSRSADPEVATRELVENKGGPPAHGSVMFRRSAYHLVGGYRRQFYFSQDSDLWLRMAGHCRFACLPTELYAFRKHGASITSIHRGAQTAFGRIGQQCKDARLRGESELSLLAEADNLSNQLRSRRTTRSRSSIDTTLYYMIGSRLARDGQASASEYLWPVVRRIPWHGKAWVRLVQSYWNRLVGMSAGKQHE